jgi:hypothetical protein
MAKSRGFLRGAALRACVRLHAGGHTPSPSAEEQLHVVVTKIGIPANVFAGTDLLLIMYRRSRRLRRRTGSRRGSTSSSTSRPPSAARTAAP